jgi:hypothetical protein
MKTSNLGKIPSNHFNSSAQAFGAARYTGENAAEKGWVENNGCAIR